jgi:hypothetical protein
LKTSASAVARDDRGARVTTGAKLTLKRG